LKDRVDDAVDAWDIYKADHGPGAPDLYKNAFNEIGGAQLPPQIAEGN
jgi:hypothetical protein